MHNARKFSQVGCPKLSIISTTLDVMDWVPFSGRREEEKKKLLFLQYRIYRKHGVKIAVCL